MGSLTRQTEATTSHRGTQLIANRGMTKQGLKGKRADMQQMEQAVLSGTDRRRTETVAQTLAHLCGNGESVAELMHDARNMVTALGLYCGLLEEPGVLTTPFLHYGSELKLVAAASRRLVERLVAIETGGEPGAHDIDDDAFEQTGLSWMKTTP